MNISPKALRYRVELLQPNDAKYTTGVTKGEFNSYASRYAGRLDQVGNDTNYNDQDVAFGRVVWLIRYDANVKVSWVVRYGSEDYMIEAIQDADDGKKAYLRLYTIKREQVTLAVAP